MTRRNINIEFSGEPVEMREIELVERKGLGHPDSICDGLAEAVSRELSKEYLKRFDYVMHHNTDQVELVGGEVNTAYGAGEVIKPIYILLSGRATTYVGSEKFPVHKIAIHAAKKYLKENFLHLGEYDVIIDSKIGQGSSDLCNIFDRQGVPKSNDTSFGCSFAPFSTTEELVYGIERYITKKRIMKEVGEDVKVMGLRNKDKITITVAAPLISKYISDLDDYKNTINELKIKIDDFAAKLTDKDVEIHINTGDDYEKESVYLTVTGTSAEQGDDGSVGRGNRANGLISLFRPMSMEATAGKNPINHVGKIYNLLSKEIARDIADEGAEQVYVRLMSQIGKPIDHPLMVSLQLIGNKNIENKARKITDYWLENISKITTMCIEGKAQTF